MDKDAPRRHHFIPQMLLRNFCDANGLLWVSDRGKIYQSAPEKVFAQRDLYTTFKVDHAPGGHDYEEFTSLVKKSYEYEKLLSELEGKAAPAMQQIIEQARLGRCPQLSPEDNDSWKRFFLALARRTPESQKRVSGVERFDVVFYKAVKAVAESENHPLPDWDSLHGDPRVPPLVGLVESNVNAKFAAGDHPKERERADNFSRETGLCVATIRISERSFVIGSHGIAIVEASRKGDPAQGSWLPIAHDVAVQATGSPEQETLAVLDGDRVITAINRASAEKSWRIAGRSEDLVRSLMQGQS